ncbi:MAG TPA: hypothetical protein VFA81_08375 [Burkholderiales bacterium]|nr:hypothetical protein [Burkholderiales bacterium]
MRLLCQSLTVLLAAIGACCVALSAPPESTPLEFLGFKLGVTTMGAVAHALNQKHYVPTETGPSLYTKGPIYDVDPAVYPKEGFRKLTFVFDIHQRLAAIVTTIDRSRYESLVAELRHNSSMFTEFLDDSKRPVALAVRGNGSVLLEGADVPADLYMVYQTTEFSEATTRDGKIHVHD